MFNDVFFPGCSSICLSNSPARWMARSRMRVASICHLVVIDDRSNWIPVEMRGNGRAERQTRIEFK